MSGIYTTPSEGSFKSDEQIIEEAKLEQLKSLDQQPRYETPLPEDKTFDYWVDRFEARAKQKRETDEAVTFARIVLPDHPCLLTMMWDQHVGNEFTRYDVLKRHSYLIKETPFSYLGNGGDFADWYANFAPIQAYNESEQFPEQAEFMWRFFKFFNDGEQPNKLLFVNVGNHDDKWAKKTGLSPYHDFSRKFGAYLFRGIGTVELQVGSQTYTGLTSHMLQGFSIHNPNHPQARTTNQQGVYDFIFSGHTHAKAIQQRAYRTASGGKRTVFANGGTYKETDYYIQDQGMGDKDEAEMYGTSFIFLNDQKYIVPFYDIDVAHAFFRKHILGLND